MEIKHTPTPDWYEQRHALQTGQIFSTKDGSMVKLDRRVPGDGTKWFVADWLRNHWSHEDSTIEPSDLDTLFDAAALAKAEGR